MDQLPAVEPGLGLSSRAWAGGVAEGGLAGGSSEHERESPPDRRTPTASLGRSSRRVKDRAVRPWRHCLGASLPRRCGRPVGVRFSAVPPMASPLSPSRRQQPAVKELSRSALRARDAQVLEHLRLAVAERFREAVAIASATARRLFPLVEREDLIQVAREALVRSAPRCRAGEPAAPYLRRCISGALQHHLRDRVRLVRVPRRVHELGQCPLGHLSLDAAAEGMGPLVEQLAAEAPHEPTGPDPLALEALVEQLPAGQAAALRLTLINGLSLRAAADAMGISAMSVQRAQKKALIALRQQLSGRG